MCLKEERAINETKKGYRAVNNSAERDGLKTESVLDVNIWLKKERAINETKRGYKVVNSSTLYCRTSVLALFIYKEGILSMARNEGVCATG